MRKLLLLGIAALLAFRGGRGFFQQARSNAGQPAIGDHARRNVAPSRGFGIGLGEIFALWFAPRWLRPVMIARTIAAQRSRRRGVR